MPHNLTQYIHRVGRTARAGKKGTAVTLVGEAERKLLKEIVKNAKDVPKSRVVPPGIIERYREKIESMASDIKAIVQQEKEERMVCCIYGLQCVRRWQENGGEAVGQQRGSVGRYMFGHQ